MNDHFDSGALEKMNDYFGIVGLEKIAGDGHFGKRGRCSDKIDCHEDRGHNSETYPDFGKVEADSSVEDSSRSNDDRQIDGAHLMEGGHNVDQNRDLESDTEIWRESDQMSDHNYHLRKTYGTCSCLAGA